MTYHIKCQEYRCPECSALYIPFRKDFTCPQCEKPVEGFFDFIPELISSIRGNKRKYGEYTPSAWMYLYFSDYVQQPIFCLFDCLEAEMPEDEIDYINNWFDKNKWGKEYLKKHTKEIALLVYEDYKANRKLYLSLRQKIKSWWKRPFVKIFMP